MGAFPDVHPKARCVGAALTHPPYDIMVL